MKPFLSSALLMASFAIMVIDAKAEQKVLVAEFRGNGARFFLSEILQSEANVLLGTSGPVADNAIVMIGPGRVPGWSTKTRREIDIDCGGEGQDEIKLFPGIQPRDGTWLTRVTTRMEGCPPMVQQAIAANLPGPQTDTRRMEWPRPFDPNQLSRDFNPGYIWRPAGEDR